MRTCWLGVVAVLTSTLAACGDNLPPGLPSDAAPDAVTGDGNQADAGPDAPIDGPPSLCGNTVVEAGEACDDGDTVADAVCTDSCQFTCGNGTVEPGFGELCDVAIGSGDGACPVNCDDLEACTQDVLTGTGCQAACEFGAITVPIGGDGCCPAGADNVTDSDCAPVCGNAVLEAGEGCDTGITSGAGACPNSCADGQACTSDVLANAGTCDASCSNPPITEPANNDGCCPPLATPQEDNDCIPGCGNGIVDPGETCDTGLVVGPGSCPTTCVDGQACTADVLTNGDTCTAFCAFPAITEPTSGDGCCPAGANANNDSDCAPVCGNTVVEEGEACDDGNSNPADGCDGCQVPVTPTAFRLSDLDLRDPHVFINLLGCRDITDVPLAGFSVNGELQTNIQTDGNADGLLDLSYATVFRPLTQVASAITPLELHGPTCTAPIATASCEATPAGFAMVPTEAAIQATDTCLTPVVGTVRPYSPAVTSAFGPCFVGAPVTLTITLAGIPLTLQDAQFAATFVGVPANNTVNGLLRGFISEADANATIIPASFPLVGGLPLSSLLPGGTNNCAPHDDRDIHNGTLGWWFYFNYTAPRVLWSE